MPDVLGTQRCLIHNLCLERNQDLVPYGDFSVEVAQQIVALLGTVQICNFPPIYRYSLADMTGGYGPPNEGSIPSTCTNEIYYQGDILLWNLNLCY